MEENNPARRSSGIYESNYNSTHSFASGASLAANAAQPAGITRTTSAGVPVGGAITSNVPGQVTSGWEDNPATAVTTPPTQPRPFYKKRWFIISQLIIIPLGIALLFILLFPVVRAIIQLVINRTTIDIQSATISQPDNNTFALHLQGNVAHTGIISAKIQFLDQIDVYWFEENMTKKTFLGHMRLDEPLSAKSKRAVLDQTTTFVINNMTDFGRFSSVLITTSSFVWHLSSSNLRVQALKFPVAKGLHFEKNITLTGFNSFNSNVALRDFTLPSDNPAGGIDFVAVTELINPSPFSLNLGTVQFALSYKDVALGVGTGTDVSIAALSPNVISLSGVLVPHTDPGELTVVSELFTQYLNGETSQVIATGLATLQSDNTSISWLSDGLKALNLNVPFKSFVPIDPIKTITIGNLGLQFDKESPWTPSAESNSVVATLQLPFGFGLAINDIKNDFNIVSGGNPVAGLSTPLGASTSAITVFSQDNTAGSINITINNTRLSCPDPQHPAFSTFNADLTSTNITEFRIVGNSRAVAKTNIGQITLDPIKVDVPTTLKGLQGLQGMTTIEDVDVTGGTKDGIILAINVTIFNPSNLNLSTGDLTLQLFRDDAVLGTALLPNLILQMGPNNFTATSSFEANNNPQGLQTLDDFVGKKDTELIIGGFEGSTEVASLLQAFQTLHLGVTLPGLKVNLLDTADLEVLPTTGRENNISHVSVSLDNPFSASLHITRISSTVKAFGISLGTIDTTTDFTAEPKATTKSPTLDLLLNFDPSTLFTLTRVLASEAGLDVSPLDSIVQLGDIQYLPGVVSEVSQVQANFDGFNLPNFVQSAFKMLKSDVELTSDVTIGDYQTKLNYVQPSVPTATDESLNLILPILAQPIVQKIVGGSALGIETVLIKNPMQNSFSTTLKGSISNAGPFDAKIAFPSGLSVNWNGSPLGIIKLDGVTVTGNVGGSIDSESTFEVLDVNHLTDFTKALLTEESFEWEISGENLTVSALGIDVTGVALSTKVVSLKGFNGLKGGVQIQTFDLPSNDAAGGIHLTIDATTANPSQVGIELSSIAFNTFVGDVMIAPISASSVTLSPGETSKLALVGRLIPQDSPAGLATVSEVFNNFVHGKDSDVIVRGAAAGPSGVTWLNEGIKALEVATILPNRGPLEIIKAVTLNELKLVFTENTAYNPATSSNSTDAAFTLPFGFPLDVTALEQTITVGFEGTDFAQLAIPKGPSNTDVEARIIHLSFENVPFAVSGDLHPVFDRFVAATTVGGTQTLKLSGTANADARTAVGLLSLQGIDFAVSSNIEGLQGLNTRPVTINNLDVNHGFPDHLLIKVDSGLFNPSTLTIGTGDVSFALQFQDQNLGTANLNDLVIVPGNATYHIDVNFAPSGGAVDAGRALLENFLQGVDVNTVISGTSVSTPIDSLKSGLSQIRLSPVTIPAIHQNLVKSASLTFPIDIVHTGLASTSFTLANPFTASINLLSVKAIATFQKLTLGVIDNVDTSIHADGHGSVSSPNLPLKFNTDPLTIIQLLLLTSQQNGVNLGPLIDLFGFVMSNPNFKPPIMTSVDTRAPTCVSGKQFDANGVILKSLSNLKVNLAVDSSVKLDDFPIDLSFNQLGVPAAVDKSALFLIGAVAGPITQHLVDGSVLEFTDADISNISDEGFDLSLKGSLTNIGPLDALITFVEPVTVTWQGRDIAKIALPPICAAANDGVPDYEARARLTITDLSAFTDFATFLLHNPSFEWTISTSNLRVTALGTIFDNVNLSKVVSFKAFNNLPGVTISNFQLPSDDPAGGIHIETDAMIPSKAQIGIDLGMVTFQAFFQGTQVGPLSGNNLSLAANAVTSTHLSGRILQQSGTNLDNMGVLFSNFLAGKNQTLETKGDSVQPTGSNQPVSWLSTAFKTLTLEVVLPGQKFDVIQSIQLNDLQTTIVSEDRAFSPPASSEFTLAKYKNPFGFSLQVVAAGQTIILASHGTDIAQLVLPKESAIGGVSTGNLADLIISFHDQPLQSLNDAAFQQLLAGATLMDVVELELKGNADVTARTSIGDVAISGIPFDVTTSLKGINSFGGTASLSNVSVVGSGGAGGSEFIVSPLITTLQNPSNISLNTTGVSLPVIFNGVNIGRAAINEFDLMPGENVINTEFHYEPANANDTVAQSFLTEFIQTNNNLGLTIHGDGSSSPFGSLQPALANVALSTSLTGLNQPTLITAIHVLITSLTEPFVSVDFDVQNPLDAELILEFVQSDGSVDGTVFAQFSQGFSNFSIPPGETRNSGRFDNVFLPQGILGSLDIIPLQMLDVAAASTVRIGEGGYQIPWLKLNQTSVPTSYEIILSGLHLTGPNGLAQLKDKAKAILSNSSASSRTASLKPSVSASNGRSVNMPPPTKSTTVPEVTTEATKESSFARISATSEVKKVTAKATPETTADSPKTNPSIIVLSSSDSPAASAA